MVQQHLRVLLVEDSHGDQRLVQEWLSGGTIGTFDVQCRDSLAAGLECLGQREIDVVLLDLNLPDSHGIPTCTKVLGQFPECPIVVLTGVEDRRVAIEAVQCGAADYLVKGEVDESTLPRALRRAIERHSRAGAFKQSGNTGHGSAGQPCWDAQLRELRLGRVLVKQFRQPSANQERILSAFQEEGWPPRIDDPLPPDPEHDPKQRLRTTLKSLNRSQQQALIRFRSDGTGQGILWTMVEENKVSSE